MTVAPFNRANAIDQPTLAAGLRDLVGPALFSGVLLLVFISLDPFPDRSGAALLGTQEGGAVANQIIFPAIALALIAFVAACKPWAFKVLYHPILLAVGIWFALTVITSSDPALSARRQSFNVVIVVVGALMIALPRRQSDFADGLAAMALIVLVACWAGVIFWPQRSMHLLTDALETDLAGNWRGIYPHKNQTGASMALLVFVGLYYARVRSIPIGWIIVLLAAVFLYFTKSKTSIALLPFVLIMSAVVPRLRTLSAKAALVFGLLALFSFATIGSSVPGPTRSIVRTLLPDATFTGRTDLWAFAIENIAERPVFGHGYGAFWRTGATSYRDHVAVDPESQDNWAAELGTDAHNAYLEIALSIGLPGLVLIFIWHMVLPLIDFHRVKTTPENQALLSLFLRVWLLGVYLASLETILFDRTGQNWFMLLIAIFGLRMLVRCQIAPVRSQMTT